MLATGPGPDDEKGKTVFCSFSGSVFQDAPIAFHASRQER